MLSMDLTVLTVKILNLTSTFQRKNASVALRTLSTTKSLTHAKKKSILLTSMDYKTSSKLIIIPVTISKNNLKNSLSTERPPFAPSTSL